jgi:small subunit ribosomal protein S16
MVKIRMARGGAKRRPFYTIVATNSRSSRDGRNIEQLGFYNPVASGNEVKLKLDVEKVEQWVKNGAQLSDKVAYLLKQAKAAPVAAVAAA